MWTTFIVVLRKEELERGYWGDANELAKNKDGKLFDAVPKLTPKNRAGSFFQGIPVSLPTYKPFSLEKVNLKQVRSHVLTAMKLGDDRRAFPLKKPGDEHEGPHAGASDWQEIVHNRDVRLLAQAFRGRVS